MYPKTRDQNILIKLNSILFFINICLLLTASGTMLEYVLCARI